MLRTLQTTSALAAIGFVGFIYLIPISYLLGVPIVGESGSIIKTRSY